MPRVGRPRHRTGGEQSPIAFGIGLEQEDAEPPDLGQPDEFRRAAERADPAGDAQLGQPLGARVGRGEASHGRRDRGADVGRCIHHRSTCGTRKALHIGNLGVS